MTKLKKTPQNKSKLRSISIDTSVDEEDNNDHDEEFNEEDDDDNEDEDEENDDEKEDKSVHLNDDNDIEEDDFDDNCENDGEDEIDLEEDSDNENTLLSDVYEDSKHTSKLDLMGRNKKRVNRQFGLKNNNINFDNINTADNIHICNEKDIRVKILNKLKLIHALNTSQSKFVEKCIFNASICDMRKNLKRGIKKKELNETLFKMTYLKISLTVLYGIYSQKDSKNIKELITESTNNLKSNYTGFQHPNFKTISDSDYIEQTNIETPLKVVEGVYVCAKCKGKKTFYYQRQTRGIDEPFTTFCSCTICGNKWKFN